MDGEKRFVGIDIAKAALDVFIGSGGAAFSVTNDEVGIRELLRHLAPGDFAILEATGGLEMPAASALAAAGIAVAIVNPRQVRDFARATGRLAKTDRLDAEVLARFGAAVRGLGLLGSLHETLRTGTPGLGRRPRRYHPTINNR